MLRGRCGGESATVWCKNAAAEWMALRQCGGKLQLLKSQAQASLAAGAISLSTLISEVAHGHSPKHRGPETANRVFHHTAVGTCVKLYWLGMLEYLPLTLWRINLHVIQILHPHSLILCTNKAGSRMGAGSRRASYGQGAERDTPACRPPTAGACPLGHAPPPAKLRSFSPRLWRQRFQLAEQVGPGLGPGPSAGCRKPT